MEEIKESIWLEEQERKSWASEWETTWAAKEEEWNAAMKDMKRILEEGGKNQKKKTEDGDDEGERELQVIAGGWTEDIDADEIIKELNKFIDDKKLRNKIDDIDTFTDPGKIGVITFQNVAARNGFLKKPNKMKDRTGSSGAKLWFQKNATLDERYRNRLLGQVKSKLIDIKGAVPDEVKINRKTMVVKYNGSKVAWLEGGKLQIAGQAQEFREDIAKEVQEWYDERNID